MNIKTVNYQKACVDFESILHVLNKYIQYS